ncbi:MAG: hypothetical protein ACMUJM_14960 [bacterium]
MSKKKIKLNIAIIIFCFFCINYVTAKDTFKDTSELVNKIAFLKEGDVWISNVNGEKIEQLTNTKGKIEGFLFSPNLRYIAYSKVIIVRCR